MPQAIITKLSRILSGKTSGRIALPEFVPGKFYKLFDTQTLRLITNWDFCAFGRTELEKVTGWSRKESRPMADYPPSCTPTVPFWFELEDDKIANGDGTISREPQALWMTKSYPDGTSEGFLLSYDAGGWLRCIPLAKEDQGVVAFRISRLMGALFVMNEMPTVVSREIRDNVEIPSILRDSHSSAFSLFSRRYLRREFSDVLGAAYAAQKTLDISGRRFHYVRGHWMLPHGKSERVWRKFHWRGDPSVGISRGIYVGA